MPGFPIGSDAITPTVYWMLTHLWSDATTLTVYWTPKHLWYDARVSNRIISQSSIFEFVSLSSLGLVALTLHAKQLHDSLSKEQMQTVSQDPPTICTFLEAAFFCFLSAAFLPFQWARSSFSHLSLWVMYSLMAAWASSTWNTKHQRALHTILELEHKASTCIKYCPWSGTQSINVHHIPSLNWNTKHQRASHTVLELEHKASNVQSLVSGSLGSCIT